MDNMNTIVDQDRARSVDASLRVQYYYNYFDIDDQEVLKFDLGAVTDDPATAGIDLTFDLDRSTRSTRHEIEIQKIQRLTEGHRFVLGEWIWDDVRDRSNLNRMDIRIRKNGV